jgi:YVTN family beta-propeller protein
MFALTLIAIPAVHAGTQTIELDPGIINGFGAEDLVVNPATNRIYAANTLSGSVSVVDGDADALIINIAVGDDPSSIDVNTATNRIYVVNESGNTVSVIDGSTDTVMATINVGSTPVSLMVNEDTNRIYVVNSEDSTVSVINGSTNTLEATIGVGNPSDTYGPTGMDINRTTKRVYVPNMDTSDVYVIDGDPTSPSFNTVIATISPEFTGGWGVLFVAVNEATNTVYIVNGGFWFPGSWYGEANVAIINGTTNTLITNIPLPGVYWADDPTVNENTNYFYLIGTWGEEILIIDGSTNTLTQTVPATDRINNVEINKNTNLIYAAGDFPTIIVLDGNPSSPTFHEVIAQGGDTESNAIAINEVTNRIYAIEWEGGLLVFDGVTNTLSQYISTGGTTVDLGLDEVNNRVWVAHTSTSGIKIIDTTTNKVTDLALGAPIGGVLLNPNTNRAYAASTHPLSQSMIKVIDTSTIGVEADIPVTNHIEDGAMNLQTNRLYVINGDEVAVIEGNPASTDFNTTIATIPVGVYAEGLAVNEKTNFVYVGGETEGGAPSDIYVIDGSTNRLSTTITVGVSADVIAINQTTNRIYTSNDDSHSISVIDGDPLSSYFHTVIETIALASNPEYLLVSEPTNRLYVNVDENSTIVVINCSTNTIEEVIPLRPDSGELQLALDSALRKIYATDEETDVVYIIDGDPASPLFNTIIETMDVGGAPWSIVVDETTHRAYVSNEDDNTISVILNEDVEACEGDFEPDGDVDGSDLAVFAADFGRTDCDIGNPCEGDFNNDGDVDGSDLAAFAADFGRTDCP